MQVIQKPLASTNHRITDITVTYPSHRTQIKDSNFTFSKITSLRVSEALVPLTSLIIPSLVLTNIHSYDQEMYLYDTKGNDPRHNLNLDLRITTEPCMLV